MNIDSKVIDVANYIIKNKATIDQTSQYFDMSTSSIKKYINNRLIDIDKSLYDEVKKVQDELQVQGRIIGGQIGKRGRIHTSEEIEKIASEMIEKSLTLEEASQIYDIPTSTLYENLSVIKDIKLSSKLEALYLKNKGMRVFKKNIDYIIEEQRGVKKQ